MHIWLSIFSSYILFFTTKWAFFNDLHSPNLKMYFFELQGEGFCKKNPQCIHSRGVYMPVGNLSADMPIPHITKIYFRLNVWKNLIFIISLSKRIPLKFLELNNKAKSFDWLQKLFDVLLNPTWKLKMCAGATKMQCLRARGYI